MPTPRAVVHLEKAVSLGDAGCPLVVATPCREEARVPAHRVLWVERDCRDDLPLWNTHPPLETAWKEGHPSLTGDDYAATQLTDDRVAGGGADPLE